MERNFFSDRMYTYVYCVASCACEGTAQLTNFQAINFLYIQPKNNSPPIHQTDCLKLCPHITHTRVIPYMGMGLCLKYIWGNIVVFLKAKVSFKEKPRSKFQFWPFSHVLCYNFLNSSPIHTKFSDWNKCIPVHYMEPKSYLCTSEFRQILKIALPWGQGPVAPPGLSVRVSIL